MNKTIRKRVHAKYGGRCAYCGEVISLEEMQVDHFIPVGRGCTDGEMESYLPHRGTDDFDNLMPSCRMCNFYKARNDIEGFRNSIKTWLDYKRTFATRLALKYGILTEHEWSGRFYYETFKAKDNERD
jgi:5-methylcytosine-specific restriction endonuclease McrA